VTLYKPAGGPPRSPAALQSLPAAGSQASGGENG
jgi:hypothetical protein